jgi:hypothetical protein
MIRLTYSSGSFLASFISFLRSGQGLVSQGLLDFRATFASMYT